MTEVRLPILDLRVYQKPIWNYMMQGRKGLRGVTVWPRRNGKDLTAINILAAKALQRKGDYAYIAPFANQTRGIIWEGSDGGGTRFIDYIPQEVITRKLDQSMKLWLSNGSTIQLFGSDNPDALVGRNFIGLVFTEFSLHKDAVWGYLRPMLAENGGWALFNGTPRGMNHFYAMANTAKKNAEWFYERLTAEDTGFPSLADIQTEREAGMAESLIEQEFYTSWTSSSEETLIPLENIQRCFNTPLAREEYDFAPRVIGVDPAYAEKGDRATIARRQGRLVHPLESYQGIDPMELAARVATHLRDWRAHFCFVDSGRGEAVWSRLFQLGFEDRVIPVHFVTPLKNDLYARKKDQIWGRMKNAVCDPDRPLSLPEEQQEELARDLGAPTYEINDRGQVCIESKKSLIKRGFRSTDWGDALALTWSEELDETPLTTQAMRESGVTEDIARRLLLNQTNQTTKENYDPLTYMDAYTQQAGSFTG